MTSHDVIYRLRRLLSIKKIGHTGTLDPDASGVLPVCVGRATKTADMLTAADKQYEAEITLGAATDTQDASGRVIARSEVLVTEAEIRRAVQTFVGESEQIPPMFSALKVNGKKLYELAREGKEVERKPRKIRIDSIEILQMQKPMHKFTMRIDCSKGTYIRTLCHDIGEKLGCYAHMSALCRTRSGRFSLEDAYPLEKIAEMEAAGDRSFLVPVDKVFSEFEKIILTPNKAQKMCNGTRVHVAGLKEGCIYRIYDEKGKFLTISQEENGTLKILKTFYQSTNG